MLRPRTLLLALLAVGLALPGVARAETRPLEVQTTQDAWSFAGDDGIQRCAYIVLFRARIVPGAVSYDFKGILDGRTAYPLDFHGPPGNADDVVGEGGHRIVAPAGTLQWNGTAGSGACAGGPTPDATKRWQVVDATYTLPDPGTVRGTVTDVDGRPVAGVAVGSTTTDAAGRYELEAAGEYAVSVAGYCVVGREPCTERAAGPIEPGEVVTVDFRARPLGPLGTPTTPTTGTDPAPPPGTTTTTPTGTTPEGGRRPTRSELACARTALGATTATCTATVTDVGPAPRTRPTGDVALATRAGTVAPDRCALRPVPGTEDAASCTTTYAAGDAGLPAGQPPAVQAGYAGDGAHAPSTATAGTLVEPPAGVPTTPLGPTPVVVLPTAPAGPARAAASARTTVRAGVLALPVSCPAGGAACAGEVSATASGTRAGLRAAGARKQVVLARKAYRAAAGTRATVRLRLSAAARRALAKRSIRATVRVTTAGAATTTARTTLKRRRAGA